MPSLLAPRLWVGHVLMVVAVVAAFLLGSWQLGSWQDRRASEAEDLTAVEPVALSDLMTSDEAFPGAVVGRPVDVSGNWVDDLAIFVEGRELKGRDGFWMVGVLDEGGAGVPVVLGWVEDPTTSPDPPSGSASLVGLLQPPEGTGAFDEDPADDVVPQLRVADLQQRVDIDLYSAYVVARGGLAGLPEADLAAVPESSRFTALRNLLYGLEWWIFGLFAVVIWWRWLRDECEPPSESGPDHEPVASEA